jgi:hypothetical protein
VRDYDPDWPVRFQQECRRLRFVVGPALKIEHMGSTSVSGLSAKPIIDILVGLPNSDTPTSPSTKHGYLVNCFFGRGCLDPGHTIFTSWSNAIHAGEISCCFATTCAYTRKSLPRTEAKEIARG